MSSHSCSRLVKYHRPPVRWAMGALAALLCLSTLLPATAFAQTMLPVIIKLPPSFLRSSPVASPAKAETPMGVMKDRVGVPMVEPQIAAVRNAEVRATELRGLLPHQFDHHFLGLEATEPGGSFAVTLVVEPAAVLLDDSVNFVVLTADGMRKYMNGADPLAVKTAIGSPLLFDQVGNRLTALVPGNADTEYTVVVFNNSKLPVTYIVQVMGGLLVDDAGQTFSSVKVSAPTVEGIADLLLNEVATVSTEETVPAETYEGIVKRLGVSLTLPELPEMVRQILPESVRARQVSGALANMEDRHYLNLAADTGGGDITLTLHYDAAGGVPTHLNFWVMTQDGVRQLVQGGLAQDLNLAMGLPVAGKPGVYQARLRMAENMLYTVVVYSEGVAQADYTLSVQGGILVDRYGQTREAQAAEIEVMALATK